MATALKESYEKWLAHQAQKELKRWASLHKRDVFSSRIKCNLAEVIELGLHIPSGYGAESTYYPDVLQTQRVWAFMPSRWRQAIYMHYVFDTSHAQNALALGLSRNQFRRYIASGFKWYCQYRDTDFSSFDL